MIELLPKNKYKELLEYIIDNDLLISPYIPINLYYYQNVDNDNYKVEIIKNNERYDAIISIYYNDVQLWVSNYVVISELKLALLNKGFEIIYGPTELLNKIDNNIREPGHIYVLKKKPNFIFDNSITICKKPNNEDYLEIAKLVSNDPELQSHSTIRETMERYKWRNENGMSRNYFCYNEKGKLIGHAGTHAESDRYGVIGGVVVHPDYRGKHIGSTLISQLCLDLIKEQKLTYLVAHNPEAVRIYEKIGFSKICSWGAIHPT